MSIDLTKPISGCSIMSSDDRLDEHYIGFTCDQMQAGPEAEGAYYQLFAEAPRTKLERIKLLGVLEMMVHLFRRTLKTEPPEDSSHRVFADAEALVAALRGTGPRPEWLDELTPMRSP